MHNANIYVNLKNMHNENYFDEPVSRCQNQRNKKPPGGGLDSTNEFSGISENRPF